MILITGGESVKFLRAHNWVYNMAPRLRKLEITRISWFIMLESIHFLGGGPYPQMDGL